MKCVKTKVKSQNPLVIFNIFMNLNPHHAAIKQFVCMRRQTGYKTKQNQGTKLEIADLFPHIYCGYKLR